MSAFVPRTKGGGLGWGPPNGPGWGGEAKPKGARPPRKRRLKKEADAAMAQMMQVWADIALNSPNEMARIVAADKLANRIEGLPVQKSISLHAKSEMTFEKMVEAALRRGKPAIAPPPPLIEGGEVEETDSPE